MVKETTPHNVFFSIYFSTHTFLKDDDLYRALTTDAFNTNCVVCSASVQTKHIQDACKGAYRVVIVLNIGGVAHRIASSVPKHVEYIDGLVTGYERGYRIVPDLVNPK